MFEALVIALIGVSFLIGSNAVDEQQIFQFYLM